MSEHAMDDDIKDGWILITNKKGVRVWIKEFIVSLNESRSENKIYSGLLIGKKNKINWYNNCLLTK